MTTTTPVQRSGAPAGLPALALTGRPLRNRVRVRLDAPVEEVWTLVGDHTRLPEYCGGIVRVEVDNTGDSAIRVCHFQPEGGSAEGVRLRERITWFEPPLGYAASAEPDDAFGLSGDLSVVALDRDGDGTVFTWSQYFDAADLPALIASFDDGLADIANRLVARFGGSIVERYAESAVRMFDVQAIEIRAPRQRVFDFVREPRNLPRWAHAFVFADDERARLQTPAGVADVGLRTLANQEAGSVDWEIRFPGGATGLAHSRVTDTGRRTCIYSFVLHAPPVPLEQLEGALAVQRVTLESELVTLKALLEG